VERSSPNEEFDMGYHVVARWPAHEGELAKVEAVLRELAPASRNEPGNEQFVVHHFVGNPNEIVLYEMYTSEEALLNTGRRHTLSS